MKHFIYIYDENKYTNKTSMR